MVHVDRGHTEPELAKDVPQTRRVGAAGDEAGDLPSGGDQVVPAHGFLDALGEGDHAPILARKGRTR